MADLTHPSSAALVADLTLLPPDVTNGTPKFAQTPAATRRPARRYPWGHPRRRGKRCGRGGGGMARQRPVGYQARLSIVEHLDELRTRLVWCIVAFILAFSVCYWQNGWILHTMNKPLRDAQQGSGKKHSTLQEQA